MPRKGAPLSPVPPTGDGSCRAGPGPGPGPGPPTYSPPSPPSSPPPPPTPTLGPPPPPPPTQVGGPPPAPPPPTGCLTLANTCGPDRPSCDNGTCCSQWGYCGTTQAHCGTCCQSGMCEGGPPPTPGPPRPTPGPPRPTRGAPRPPEPPPPPPTTCRALSATCGPDRPCGNGACCSQWGYCGTTEAHCGECCQSDCWEEEGKEEDRLFHPPGAP